MEPFYTENKNRGRRYCDLYTCEVGIEGVEIQDKQPLTDEGQGADVCGYHA